MLHRALTVHLALTRRFLLAVATGAVSFHNDKLVKRVYIPTRDNAVVNRLNKTKVVREVDHEAERIERQRREGKTKKALANDLVRRIFISRLRERRGEKERADRSWLVG